VDINEYKIIEIDFGDYIEKETSYRFQISYSSRDKTFDIDRLYYQSEEDRWSCFTSEFNNLTRAQLMMIRANIDKILTMTDAEV